MDSYQKELAHKDTNLDLELSKLNSEIRILGKQKFIPSPIDVRYRNKINLSFGKNIKGNLEVGTMIKNKFITPAKDNQICSQIAVDICEFMKFWLINESKLTVIDYSNMEGYWRHLTIHNTIDKKILIVFHVQSISKYQSLWDSEKDLLIKSLYDFIRKREFLLESVFYQNSEELTETRNYHPYYHIYGEKFIIERLDKYYFKISPGSFFQVNSLTACILYKKVLELANLDKNKIVLDICCGTGIIGIFLANHCDKVYSIDSSQININDAIENSKNNDIENIEFICNTAEKALPILLSKEDFFDKEVIAIINPPRKGVYKEVIDTINKYSISQLIYVSCNAKTLVKDLNRLDIARSKCITNIVPIDQFPKTNHYETIISI